MRACSTAQKWEREFMQSASESQWQKAFIYSYFWGFESSLS
jgi:hypothetical protein